ncbi:MAG: hypothetical protein AB7V08_08485 [Elusimicrobiales bacterium]
MLAKIFGALLFLVGLVSFLQGETRTYLVKRAEHFPQDRFVENWSPLEYRLFVNTGKKTIGEAGGQPFHITSYQINYDGKYALLSVTTKDEDERWHYASMESKGYIVLLSTMDVVGVYDSRIGGYRTEVVFQELADLPTDYYQVTVSTP